MFVILFLYLLYYKINNVFLPNLLMKTNFVSILPKEQIIDDKDGIAMILRNCIDVVKTISCVLIPVTKQEVISIVLECRKKNLSYYCFSTGNNWGYGSKNPVFDSDVLIDLSQLDTIIDVSEELCVARIEPGVTQGDLSLYLREKNLDLLVNVTGAGPNCSILGNSLERGFGVGLHNESFDQLIDLEVLLPNGDVIKTGYGHFEENSLSHIRGHGIGPDLKGLFAQSNLGIVLEATIKLQRKPKYCELMVLHCEDDSSMLSFLEEVRELKHAGVFTNTVQFFNNLRVISVLKGKPDLSQTHISQSIIEDFSKRYSLSKWSGMTILCGDKKLVSYKKKLVLKKAKKNSMKVDFYSEKKILFLKKHSILLSKIKGYDLSPFLSSLHQAFNLFNGIPFNEALNSCYYRNSQVPIEYNPAKENCGLFWVSPISPLTTKDEEKVYTIIKEGFEKYNFDLFMTVNVLNERQITNIVGLAYNKENTQEALRAKKCHEEVIKKLIKAGYLSYRLGVEDMSHFVDTNDTYWTTIYNIKSLFDKKHLFAKGRYCLKNEE